MFSQLCQKLLHRRILAAFLAMAFMWLPMLGWLSGIIIALITINKSRLEGFVVMLLTALSYGGLITAHYFLKDGLFFQLPVFYSIALFYGILMVWLLAVCVRSGYGWSGVLYTATLLGLLGVLLIHLILGDAQLWWVQHFDQVLRDKMGQMNLTSAESIQLSQVKQELTSLSYIANGLFTAIFSLAAIIQLMIARGVTFQLTNPKMTVMKEVSTARLPWLATVLLIAFAVLTWFRYLYFADALPVLILPFILAGIALVHGLLSLKPVKPGWFFLFYLALIVIILFKIELLVAFVTAAMLDSVINFRVRWSHASKFK